MGMHSDSPKPDISSYDTSWDKWRTEQVQTITQILTAVFKVEDEARQIKAPSRLLRRSSVDAPEAEVHQKLIQIRKQISEYEEMLKLGLQRIDSALEKIEPIKTEVAPAPAHQKVSKLRHLFAQLRTVFQK